MDFLVRHKFELGVVVGSTGAAIVKNVWYDREWKDLESGKKCLMRNFLIVPVITALALVTISICFRVNGAIWEKWFAHSAASSSSDLHRKICTLIDGFIGLSALAASSAWYKFVNSAWEKWHQPAEPSPSPPAPPSRPGTPPAPPSRPSSPSRSSPQEVGAQ